jgi:hypothetical protein
MDDGGAEAGSDAASEATTGEGGSGGEAGSDAAAFPPDCTNAPVAKWSEIYNTIIVPNCGKTCHDANDATGGGLDLYPRPPNSRAWGNLVTQTPKQGYQCFMKGIRVWAGTPPNPYTAPPATGQGAPSLMIPGDPEKSIVYSKLIGKPICGNSEPQGTPDGMLYPKTMPFTPLPNNQICMFYTWIKSGATDN